MGNVMGFKGWGKSGDAAVLKRQLQNGVGEASDSEISVLPRNPLPLPFYLAWTSATQGEASLRPQGPDRAAAKDLRAKPPVCFP